jgi:hypothetical protein
MLYKKFGYRGGSEGKTGLPLNLEKMRGKAYKPKDTPEGVHPLQSYREETLRLLSAIENEKEELNVPLPNHLNRLNARQLSNARGTKVLETDTKEVSRQGIVRGDSNIHVIPGRTRQTVPQQIGRRVYGDGV